MTPPLRLGIAGLGTVGAGVVGIVQSQADMLAARAGRTITISAVSARSRSKDRGVDLSGYAWEDDPVALAKRDDVDLFVELMGGEDGPAKASVEAALAAGKHVVTANKALLAHHGQALAEAAEDAGCALRYEAAVAGGIPIIKALSEGLAANATTRVMGVMNGTCNYILTRMEDAGLPYDDVFAEADALGYLEADPNLDVGGIDAAHKLSILSALAFGTQINFGAVDIEGIKRIAIEDIHHAGDLDFRIKLLGVARMGADGLEQSMRPCLVPKSSPLGQLSGGTNMVIVEGDAVGQIVLRGAGAGAGPTASAVMGDVMDIARGIVLPVFGQPANSLTQAKTATSDEQSAFYLRATLKNQAGALAALTTALGTAGVSVDRMRQYHAEGEEAAVLVVTHPTNEAKLNAAIAAIETADTVVEPPVVLRIITL